MHSPLYFWTTALGFVMVGDCHRWLVGWCRIYFFLSSLLSCLDHHPILKVGSVKELQCAYSGIIYLR
ncbi:hypothetical protein VTK73DRAFT_2388 [Phialemonium thermophilum]|uniref:Uncharacterized protein n=1 Tax=Phialemonium thermophilum TaxID=223376 RepID=A0ABR3VS82_9PEZI